MEYSPATPLVTASERRAARRLVERAGLTFEEGYEDLVGAFRGRRLVACGARAGRVLKMLVVHDEHRGKGLLAGVVTELMRRGLEASIDTYFILSRPCMAAVFQRLGFNELVATEHAALLEYGHSLHQYLRKRGAIARPGENSAVVVSSDPFSLSQKALVERAAELGRTAYVLVPSDGRFLFSLQERLEMARRGVGPLDNAVVTDTGPYVLSSATFPAYFLDPSEEPDEVRMALDVDLFGRHIAPAFHVTTRVIGTRPTDPRHRRYNRILGQRLGRWGIRLEQIERTTSGADWVSTERVQRQFAQHGLDGIAALVPQSTLEYLRPRTAVPLSKR